MKKLFLITFFIPIFLYAENFKKARVEDIYIKEVIDLSREKNTNRVREMVWHRNGKDYAFIEGLVGNQRIYIFKNGRKKLIMGAFCIYAPSFSKDGKILRFMVREKGKSPKEVLYNIERGVIINKEKEHHFLRIKGTQYVSYSKDGDKVAYWVRRGSHADSQYIYIVDKNGVRYKTRNAVFPMWANVADIIAFLRYNKETKMTDLYIIDYKTLREEKVVEDAHYRMEWSPVDLKILVQCSGWDCEVKMVNVKTRTEVEIRLRERVKEVLEERMRTRGDVLKRDIDTYVEAAVEDMDCLMVIRWYSLLPMLQETLEPIMVMISGL